MRLRGLTLLLCLLALPAGVAAQDTLSDRQAVQRLGWALDRADNARPELEAMTGHLEDALPVIRTMPARIDSLAALVDSLRARPAGTDTVTVVDTVVRTDTVEVAADTEPPAMPEDISVTLADTTATEAFVRARWSCVPEADRYRISAGANDGSWSIDRVVGFPGVDCEQTPMLEFMFAVDRPEGG